MQGDGQSAGCTGAEREQGHWMAADGGRQVVDGSRVGRWTAGATCTHADAIAAALVNNHVQWRGECGRTGLQVTLQGRGWQASLEFTREEGACAGGRTVQGHRWFHKNVHCVRMAAAARCVDRVCTG